MLPSDLSLEIARQALATLTIEIQRGTSRKELMALARLALNSLEAEQDDREASSPESFWGTRPPAPDRRANVVSLDRWKREHG